MNAPVLTQDNLLFTVQTPLGKDQLLFNRLQGEETLNGLFHFHVEMHSESKDLDFEKLVGKNLTVKVEFAPSHVRYFICPSRHPSPFNRLSCRTSPVAVATDADQELSNFPKPFRPQNSN